MQGRSGRNDVGAAAAVCEAASAPELRLVPVDRLRTDIRLRHHAIRAEATCVDRARRFILFHGRRHPQELGVGEVTRFPSHLADRRNVSASTQNQAMAALLFLYDPPSKSDLPWLDGIVAVRTSRRLPVVSTPPRSARCRTNRPGWPDFVASLLYVTGLRSRPGVSLRIEDIEFERLERLVREGGAARTASRCCPRTCC